jgi:uncharacterized membrane protein
MDESMRMTHAETVSEACEIVKNDLAKGDLVILPYGGVVMPRVGSS